MDIPRIRQALFILDKNRKYKFDVNQTITIKNLKKMIIAAANLGKSGLRLFHKGVEYTDYEDSTFEQLFPELTLVEFNISIVFIAEEDKEQNIKVKLGEYCIYHNFKYPYFYCYDCERSICSLCLNSQEHKNHNFIEKYDYLQSSRNLVEVIFNDMNKLLTGNKFNYKSDVVDLKNRIKVTLFPALVQLVTKIEMKFLDLVDNFFNLSELSLNNMKRNVVLVKDHCAEGLDKLKTEIAIEDMMLDDEIFLTFDKKFKEISSEKLRIIQDKEKYNNLHNSYDLMFNVINDYYNEIFDFLMRYLNSNVFNEINEKIESNLITVVSKEDIFNRLLSDIKKKGTKRFTSSHKKTNSMPQSDLLKSVMEYANKYEDERLSINSNTTNNLNNNLLRSLNNTNKSPSRQGTTVIETIGK